MSIEIRVVTEVEGCHHLQALERAVWGSPDEDIVPIHVLITALRNGGMLLGAYADDGPAESGGMVGAAFWFLGAGPDPTTGDLRIKVCSHMVGVLPAWQGSRVGLRLKLAQRNAVLRQGLTNWITWTFDPLYRANAVFNLHRLGATCRTYIRNIYGEMQDALNRGVPSDRCQVDWLLDSPYVPSDVETPRRLPQWEASRLRIVPAQRRSNGFLEPVEGALVCDGAPLALPLPEEIAAIRSRDPALSLAWRLYMRQALETAFAAGYTLIDCTHLAERGWYYVLAQQP